MRDDGNIRFFPWIQLLALGLLLMAMAQAAMGEDSGDARVVALISNKIRPYADALNGVGDVLGQKTGLVLKDYWLNDYPEEAHSALRETVAGIDPMAIITIGPEALVFAQTLNPGRAVPVIHTVVLNPDRLIPSPGFFCGIPLNIPAVSQLRDIALALPDIKVLGVLFDPANNQEFVDTAIQTAKALGLDIVPLVVSSRTQISEVLEKSWSIIEGVWMIPDKTVISERIVQYIIRESIAQKKPVIGYNRFFHESGAVFSFEFDYKELGVQAGNIALSWQVMGSCASQEPHYKRLINVKVAEKINIRLSDAVLGGTAW